MPTGRMRVVLIAAGLLITTNGPLLFFAGRVIDRPGFPPPWEDAVVRPSLIGFAVAVVALVGRDHLTVPVARRIHPGRMVAFAVASFPVWAVASALWGERPELTFWRSLVYIALAFLAVAVAELEDQEFVVTIALVSGLAVAASAIVVVGWPHAGINRDDFWQGIYTNPNSLGPIAALGILAAVGWWSSSVTASTRSLAAALGIGSALTLYQTTSRTAWFALMIALGAATAVVGARSLTDRIGPHRATLVVVPATVAGALATVTVLWLRWDDPTFAQRRTIWRGAWGYVDDRWLVGYGFFSFFEVPGRATAHAFFDRGSAHSSLMEVQLGLGVVGLTLFVIVVLAAVTNSVRKAWSSPTAVAWTHLGVVVFLVVENLTESFILWFSYNWVILCAAALQRPAEVTAGLRDSPSASGSPRHHSTTR